MGEDYIQDEFGVLGGECATEWSEVIPTRSGQIRAESIDRIASN